MNNFVNVPKNAEHNVPNESIANGLRINKRKEVVNKKIISLSLLALLLWAYAQAQVPPPANCNAPLIFQVGQSHLKTVPHTKCLAPGETYTIKIVEIGGYKVALNDVTINPKLNNPGPDAWLTNKKNSANALEITIQVPRNAAENDEYGYLVIVKDVGTLDPHVRVRK